MGAFMILIFCAGVVFFGSFGEYVTGRIILPAMGLTAPHYWTWFWFMTWACIFGVSIKIISKFFD